MSIESLNLNALGIPEKYMKRMTQQEFEHFMKDDNHEIPISEVEFDSDLPDDL